MPSGRSGGILIIMMAGAGDSSESLTGNTCAPAGGTHPRWTRAAAMCLIALALGCSSSARTGSGGRITLEELLTGAHTGIADSPASIGDEQDLLALSPEMRRFLDANVEHNGSAMLRLHQLVNAIINSSTFGVEYDDTTRTAAETFRLRRGNCLSFSNLFVAMAREAGLNVTYQEVDVPPDWTLDKDTYVLNQHVNVYVDLGPEGTRVVDFNIGDFRTTYEMRRITDDRAVAHYYNNLGVARMQAGDNASALACFRRSIGFDPQFSPAWTNLGTLYLRNAAPGHAEAAFLQALRANHWDLVAMSNLSRLCELMGDHERAAAYQRQVIRHRSGNPYYRYDMARRAYSAHQYDEAIRNLKYAIRTRPKEDQFYFLLGLTYLQKGDAPAARRWLARAEQVAATDALKRKYSNKIDILMRDSR